MKNQSETTITEPINLVLSTREEELIRRLELKWRIAVKNHDKTEGEKLAKQLLEMEEFARWRIAQITKSGKEEITGADLKQYTITKWRREVKGGLVVEKKSIKEEIEEEIRRWRESELDLKT